MRLIDDLPYVLVGVVLGAAGFFLGNLIFYQHVWQLVAAVLIGGALGFIAGLSTLRGRQLSAWATMREMKVSMGQGSAADALGPPPPPAAVHYNFKQFNQTHRKVIGSLVSLYLLTLVAVWTVASWLVDDLSTALTATLLILFAEHIAIVPRLVRLRNAELGSFQYLLALCMAAVAALFVMFAYVAGIAEHPDGHWHNYKSVVLSLSLALWISVYVDFAVASAIRRQMGCNV